MSVDAGRELSGRQSRQRRPVCGQAAGATFVSEIELGGVRRDVGPARELREAVGGGGAPGAPPLRLYAGLNTVNLLRSYTVVSTSVVTSRRRNQNYSYNLISRFL